MNVKLGVGVKIFNFLWGMGGIKFEFWWGISSFSGGWGKEFEFVVMFEVAVKIFYFLGGGGIKFEFWWGFNCADWTVHLSD